MTLSKTNMEPEKKGNNENIYNNITKILGFKILSENSVFRRLRTSFQPFTSTGLPPARSAGSSACCPGVTSLMACHDYPGTGSKEVVCKQSRVVPFFFKCCSVIIYLFRSWVIYNFVIAIFNIFKYNFMNICPYRSCMLPFSTKKLIDIYVAFE